MTDGVSLYYHVTTRGRVASILRGGLDPACSRARHFPAVWLCEESGIEWVAEHKLHHREPSRARDLALFAVKRPPGIDFVPRSWRGRPPWVRVWTCHGLIPPDFLSRVDLYTLREVSREIRVPYGTLRYHRDVGRHSDSVTPLGRGLFPGPLYTGDDVISLGILYGHHRD